MKLFDYPTQPCHFCKGTGKELNNQAVGFALRIAREQSGRSLRDVAKALGVSAAYLSDLELGRRNWSPNRIHAYQAALAPNPMKE